MITIGMQINSFIKEIQSYAWYSAIALFIDILTIACLEFRFYYFLRWPEKPMTVISSAQQLPLPCKQLSFCVVQLGHSFNAYLGIDHHQPK
jgi:hypothetical protein